jgi:ribosomal protein S18 acetylase RimI-like enzyme
MKPNIKFRLATLKDRTRIHLINKESLPVVYSTYDWQLRIQAKATYVAVINGLIEGYVSHDPSMGFDVVSIALSQKYRGHGYGTQLLRFSCNSILNSHPDACITLRVKTVNDQAIQSYIKVGFKITDRLPKYYSQSECDAGNPDDLGDAYVMVLYVNALKCSYVTLT